MGEQKEPMLAQWETNFSLPCKKRLFIRVFCQANLRKIRLPTICFTLLAKLPRTSTISQNRKKDRAWRKTAVLVYRCNTTRWENLGRKSRKLAFWLYMHCQKKSFRQVLIKSTNLQPYYTITKRMYVSLCQLKHADECVRVYMRVRKYN